MTPLARCIGGLIKAYRLLVRPLIPASCRFTPSCSEYALESLSRHGAIGGVRLIFGRLLRCQPWGGFGYDPVPGDPIAQRMWDAAAPQSGNCLSRETER